MISNLQLLGDYSHFLSFIIIIYKIIKDKSCKGISAKTFEIYLLLFCIRCSDLIMYESNLYNTLMKLSFIYVTAFILFLIHFQTPYKNTYNRKEDVFPHYYLMIFAAVLTCIVHNDFSLWGITWSYSLWLESLVVLPQIDILAHNFGVANYTFHYLISILTMQTYSIVSFAYSSI